MAAECDDEVGSKGRRLLVILDVNGLLMDNAWRLDAMKHARRHPDAIAGNFLVYERPHLHAFLSALLNFDEKRNKTMKRKREAASQPDAGAEQFRIRNCDVAVWSSGRRNNVRNFLRWESEEHAHNVANDFCT